MIYKIFTVFDSKVGAYLQPFFMRSRGEAIRAYTDLCNDGKSEFTKYPEDYTLFELGEFSDMDAKFHMYDAPHSLGVALEFKKVS